MLWNNTLKDYQHYLKIERGLSKNSIDSYSSDIKKLIQFIEANAYNYNPKNINNETIQQFIYEASKVINARSQARLISGLRNFFDY